MIKFDRSKLTVQYVRIKNVTTALGGSATIVANNGHKKRVSIPLHVARQFTKLYPRQYIDPVCGAIVKYNGSVVALERNPEGNLNPNDWSAYCEQNVAKLKKAMTGRWYTDGQYAYTFDHRPEDVTDHVLSTDNRFIGRPVYAIRLSDMSMSVVDMLVRWVIQYTTDSGISATSAPVWQTIERIGRSQLNRTSGADDMNESVQDDRISFVSDSDYHDHQFDRIDEHLAVNLSFVIKAAKDISEVFGNEYIEPLRLDRLIVLLNTVNLPGVPSNVRQTYDCGIKFTEAVAWLIGLYNRSKTVEQADTVRGALRHLTTKGVFAKGALSDENVYISDEAAANIPLYSAEELANAQ